jgi:hypothetical protein
VAYGWPNGPVGAAVAAWHAASLVGSYELLLWLVRTAASGVAAREPAADQEYEPADHLVRELRLVPMPDPDGPEHDGPQNNHSMPGGHKDRCVVPAGAADRNSGPDRAGSDQAYRSADQETSDWPVPDRAGSADKHKAEDVDAAAVAAYRASIDTGKPLSERKLAAMFGKTSRRWARNRMAEAHQIFVPGSDGWRTPRMRGCIDLPGEAPFERLPVSDDQRPE